jgi:hypothetical protein
MAQLPPGSTSDAAPGRFLGGAEAHPHTLAGLAAGSEAAIKAVSRFLEGLE